MFDFANYTNGVEGWLTEDEGLFLYEITKNVKEENAAVEIGSWKGKSTICIAKGLNDGRKGKVYAIDPHTGSPEHRNIFGKVDTFKEFEEIRIAGGVHLYRWGPRFKSRCKRL